MRLCKKHKKFAEYIRFERVVDNCPECQKLQNTRIKQLEKASGICGRPWERLNICGVEIRKNSKKKVDLSEQEIFGFINCLMGIRGEELQKILEDK